MWLAVQSTPRSEAALAADLRASGYGVLWLHYLSVIRHSRRVWTVLRPYFPRYVFVSIGPGQSMGPVNEHRLVSDIVHTSEGPLEVPGAVMDELKGRGNALGCVAVSPEARRLLESGQRVRINHGPFGGLVGTVAVDKITTVGVWLSVLGREVEVNMAPGDVELIGSALDGRVEVMHPKSGGVPGDRTRPRGQSSRWPQG